MPNETVILSTAYLPPIQYVSKIVGHNNVLVEAFETYSKQSYRNRCEILSCNGPLTLSIPVVKVNGNSTLTKDIEIDNSANWQKNHWKAIESAYRNSTYFDFVADILNPHYSKKVNLLIDFNQNLLNDILKFIGIDKPMKRSDDFIKDYSILVNDFRNSIHPKNKHQALDENFAPIKYYQVFNDRFDFYTNLSVIDLLFNEGLDSLEVLERHINNKPAE